MNLVLSEKGKRVCELNTSKVESILLDGIVNCGEPIRTYLNGVLYSLLTLYSFRKLSKEKEIIATFNQLSSKSAPSFQDQLSYIKDRLQDNTEDDLINIESDDPQELADEEFDTDYEDVLSNSILLNFIANSDEAINQTKLIEEYIGQKQEATSHSSEYIREVWL